MRKVLSCLVLALALPAPFAHASDVGFNVGVNISNQPRVVVPAPPQPVYAPPQPVYAAPVPVYAPPVVIEEPPEFIEPPELGFYAAVNVPFDLFFVANTYYLCKGNVWYSAPRYNGPWVQARYRALPPQLRRYPFQKIRYYRDAGYNHYRRADNPYWNKHHFHPEKEWKERRKAEKEERKEQRKEEHEQWKQAKQWEKEQGRHGGKHGRDD